MDARLNAIFQCPQGHSLKIPRREEGLPDVLNCTGREYNVPSSQIAEAAQRVVEEDLKQIDGIQIVKVGKQKIEVNGIYHFHVAHSQMYHTLNMKWYFYGDDPAGTLERHLRKEQ